MNEVEKMTMKTPDGTATSIAALKKLFPEIVTEGKVDFDALKTILGGEVAGDERYQFTWAGKRAAMIEAAKPITKTLRPCPEQSKNWDTTENIFVEGDNLDALKILQSTYSGRVKMIYIDPPYNTGHDFIYHDNFHGNKHETLVREGVIDVESGERFIPNTESNGYFHSDWCSMMYPRLKLARELLMEDGGIIFVNLDENEITNGKKILDEIFGEKNYVTQFVWEKKKKPSFLKKSVGVITDYILCYARNSENAIPFSLEATTEGKKYPFNNAGNGVKKLTFPAGVVEFKMDDCIVPAQDMSEGNIITRLISDVTIQNGRNVNAFVLEGEWRYSQDKLNKIVADGERILISKVPFRPNHVKTGGEIKKMANLLTRDPKHYAMETNEDGTEQCTSLMGSNCFSNPKPEKLLRSLIKCCTYDEPDSVVMDFFAGSATMADATMHLNALELSSRKFICVQLPENLDEALSKAEESVRPIIKNAIALCEELKEEHLLTNVSKERIRRVGEKIKAENATVAQDLDVGFRVFKVDSSNMEDIYYAPKDVQQADLLNMVNNVKPDRKPIDLLYGCLVDWGLPIDLPHETKTINGHEVFSVGGGVLMACFDQNVDDATVKAIAAEKPSHALFRDTSFVSSAAKINVGEIFKALSPETKVRVL